MIPTPSAPPAPRSTSWGRCWLEGAGAAILLAPGFLWTEISPSHVDEYHRLLPLNTIARALAVDLVLLSLVAMLVIRALDRFTQPSLAQPPRRRPLLLLWALWLTLLATHAIASLIISQIIWWQQVTTGRALLLIAGLLLIVWLASPRLYRASVRLARGGVSLVGFCIFWMVPVLIAAGLAHQPWDQQHFVKPLPAVIAPHRRIVWLLFDEMSYDQVFAHRWPGLDLPNLDKFRAESTTFSDVQPDGRYTELVIPSIFLGSPINQVRGTPSGWMLYRTAKAAPWQPFDGRNTLFADAQREGWTTGAIGDYNPYCRILKDQLDFCWMGLPPLPNHDFHFSRDKTTLQNVVAPLVSNWRRLFEPRARPQPAPPGPSPVTDLPEVRAGDALIDDSQIDFCFVHLPLPHPPGDYNRNTGKIGPGGSYIDNLALSDRVLGHMLAEIAATPAADRTTVILSSDHSWRTWLWRHRYGWTREDELASGHGRFDPRPMLMVWFPGETTPQTIARPVPLLSMHQLVEQTMTGGIDSRSSSRPGQQNSSRVPGELGS
jgi:hypothetical protein